MLIAKHIFRLCLEPDLQRVTMNSVITANVQNFSSNDLWNFLTSNQAVTKTSVPNKFPLTENFFISNNFDNFSKCDCHDPDSRNIFLNSPNQLFMLHLNI